MVDKLRLEVLMAAVDKVTAPLKRISDTSSKTAQALKEARDKLKALQSQQAAISGLQKQIAEHARLNNELKVRTALLDGMRRSGAATAAQLQREESAVRKLTQAVQQQRTAAGQTRMALNAMGVRGSLDAAQAQLRARIDSTTASMARQRAEMERASAVQARLSAMKDRHAKHMMHAGMVAGTGYAGMAAGRTAGTAAGRFLSEGVNFNSQMSRVQALTRLDKDSPALAELRAQSQQLGADTMFSATQAAQGQAFLAMAGFKPQAIMAAMPGLLDMSKAGDMDLGRGADIASNILSAFGIDPSQMGQVADVLTKTFTTSNVTLEMLGNTMSYVGPVARAAGVDLETVSAMAGLLGNVGIQGEKAGTAMRAMLLRLAAPTSKAAKTIKTLGVQTADAAGNIRPVVDLLGEIAAKTEKMGSAERMEILKDIFGEEPAAAMSELIEKAGSDGIRQYLAEVRDNAGAAQRTAKVMADNMEGDLDELSSAWADVRIATNDANDGWMRAAAQGLTDVVRGVSGWVKEHPALVKGLSMVAIAGAAVLTVVGGLTIALALVVGKMLLVRFLLAQLGLRFGLSSAALLGFGRGVAQLAPWLLRLAGPVGALIMLAGLVMKFWQPLAAFFTGVGEGIMQGLQPRIDGLRASFAPWGAILSGVWQWFMRLLAPMDMAAQGLDGVRSAGQMLGAGLGAMLNWLVWLPERFVQLGSAIMQGLVQGILAGGALVVDAVGSVAIRAWESFKEKLGIHSPSRVFMQLGSYVSEGAALGIHNGAAMVQAAALGLSAAALAPMTAAAGATPALVTAPPMAAIAGPAASAAPVASGGGGSSYTISIQAAPGMDPQAIARAVAAELDRRERANASRRYSRLSDID